MNRELLDILRCPLTGSRLSVARGDYSNGDLEFGVLAGDGGEYPVVSGIPVLKHGQAELVGLIASGKYRLATACAIAGSKQPETATGVVKAVLPRRFRRFVRSTEQRQRNQWLARVAQAVVPEAGATPDARSLFDFYYHRCGHPAAEAFHYNFCRFGMPGHFVALSYAQSLGPRSGFVLDHSCGAGHLTWGWQRATAPAHTVGLDISFFGLYVARHITAPQVSYVCSEVVHLPFREGVFSAVFNSDAFTNFSAKLAAFREMVRTSKPDADILLVWVRNRNRDHLYPNKPLTPEAYRAIVAPYAHRALADIDTLERFLEGRGVAAARQPDSVHLEKALTLSLWVRKTGDSFTDTGRLPDDTIPFDHLAVNPVYRETSPGKWSLRFPSTFYEREDAELKHYYPREFTLSPRQTTAMAQGEAGPVADLMRVGAVVGFPAGYVGSAISRRSAAMEAAAGIDGARR